jgi:pilus assembly protein CpaE
MPELGVVILTADAEQRAVLQVLVDGTSVAKTLHATNSLPVAGSDPLLRRIQSNNADVILVDIPAENPVQALRAIELLQQELPSTAIFAIGVMSQPQLIVSAMRAGAREFIERPTTTTDLLEAFVRLTSTQRKAGREREQGKVFSVINAKGGCGSTTIAVNLALCLQEAHQNVALVDAAPLGHTALHLNAKPTFNLGDALRNLHRLDSSLLESFMTRHTDGLQFLAGANMPSSADASTSEFARLFDMLVGQYRYVVVDLSSRLDSTARLICSLSETVLLVAQTEVASLWSAGRVLQYLGDAGGRERVRLVLNRFRKIPGFSEADAETAVGAKLLWKVPNHYFSVSTSIDRGAPLVKQGSTEVSRAYSGLANILTVNDDVVKRQAWSLFRSV